VNHDPSLVTFLISGCLLLQHGGWEREREKPSVSSQASCDDGGGEERWSCSHSYKVLGG
jgi:hypothetical protein